MWSEYENGEKLRDYQFITQYTVYALPADYSFDLDANSNRLFWYIWTARQSAAK